MSIKIMAMVWKLTGIDAPQKLVLLCLADNANNQGVCWPSIPDIAERCCYDPRTIIRIIGNLTERGLINREERKGKSSIYHIMTPVVDVTPDKLSPLTSDTYTPVVDVTPTPDIQNNPPITPYKEEPSFEPSKRITTAMDLGEIAVPSWMPTSLWKDWLEVRKKKKVPNTDRALLLAIEKLSGFRDRGIKPEEILEHAILSGYQGLFEPPKKPTQNSLTRHPAPPKSNVKTL